MYGPRCVGVSSDHQAVPAAASATALAATTNKVPHCELATA